LPAAGPLLFEPGTGQCKPGANQNFRLSTVVFESDEYTLKKRIVSPDKRDLKTAYTRRLGKQPLITGSFVNPRIYLPGCLPASGAFYALNPRLCSRRDVSEMLPRLQGKRQSFTLLQSRTVCWAR
jgi:hypothetical protein